jgi:hypothetical protein
MVSEALDLFLKARKMPANADLIARWSMAMETQINVMAGDGEPVAGKRSTWTNGTETWWNIRIPHDANSEPKWDDYKLTFPFSVRAEGIGCTGWDWKAKRSRRFGFDFDALTAHAKGVGISPEDLEKVKQAAMQLPYVETRKSTGGAGIHLNVYCDDAGIPCANHTEHAALARCVLGMMSADCNFDFASQIDCCGGVMWIWHRKMTAENGGLSIIKPATKMLSEADLPSNWRDHIEVVTRKRSKVRINEIKDGDDLDTFEKLASARKIIPLDDSHKAQIAALQQTHYTTLWVADHHLLQTHTCALKEVMADKELGLVGVFETSSQGRDPGSPNCFLFPLPNGGWRAFRFSLGVSEANTWSQDGEGWTTCYFNHRPDLRAAAKLHGGLEDPDKAGYTFRTPDAAVEAAKLLGQDDITIDPIFADRRTLLKPHKDGRLVMEIERKKGDADLTEPDGWIHKKTKWVRVFETVVTDKTDDDLGQTEFDNLIRAVKTPARQFVGWCLRDGNEWVWHPSTNIKMLLQNLGNAKDAAERVMGGAVSQSWRLVNLPFQDEYPGGRQWNLDAVQFSDPPAELEPDQVPYHPHWDKIFEHIGVELTPTLRDLPWAQKANITTGADYLKAWVACAFRKPFEQLPYIFLWGDQDSGKSILHEALSVLVTKGGVVQADKALTAEFNGELAGAIICAVEEKDISLTPGAYARIKLYTTAKTIAIRQMRRDVYEVPNTTHWIQTSNIRGACPVETGDTRITVIEVLNLLPEQLIPKEEMLKELKKEAPHLLRTLLDLPLPPVINRLRLPVIVTDSKLTLMRDNLPYAPVLPFVDAMCEFDGFCGRPQLYAAYCAWIDTKTFQPFSEAAFRAELLRVTKDCKVHDDGRRLMVDEKKVFVIDGISLKGGAA